ncbi:hypothetical protein D9613_006479 [Agrocybe pediades]|uniref:Uncharacterized protein n=1 Tax=Agrocybe pediades TaxID=84607 RepID=A0A8H4QI84_9AGAR|nr:hypothetical protein D9613_006479 [Agrocybe pediades]
MAFKLLATCALLAIQAWVSLANPLLSSTSDSVSEELVRTPGGLVPKSSVHAIPEGARIHHNSTHVQLIAADGSIIHSATTSKKISTRPKITGTPTSVAPRTLESGYVAYSYWHNTDNTTNGNIATYSTTWTVPPTPQRKDGQIIYIFNGLIPASFDGILQPVLQFGSTPAGGGNYWAVASWYLVGSQTYYTVPAQVKAGQSLTGVMSLMSTTLNGPTVSYHWKSVFTSVPSTAFTLSTTEVFNYAYEALEIYYASGPTDLPTGKTMMSNITISTVGGTHPALNWTAISDSVEGFGMSVVSSSSTNGAVQITYPA